MNQAEYNKLKQLEEKNIYMVEHYKEENKSQSTKPIEAITETKIMPNGEVREVKKLRKRNVVQTTGEKKVLKRLGDKLSEKFSDR